MYPDLSYILHDIIGTDPDNWTSIFKTFGLCLAAALLSSGWLVMLELRRKEQEGLLPKIKIKTLDKHKAAIKEAVINGIIGFIIGFKLPFIIMNFEVFKADPAGNIFSADGNWLIGIAMAGIFAAYYYYTGKNTEVEATMTPGEYLVSPYKKSGDILLIAGVFGVIGARLFSILENWSDFVKHPIETIFSGSGLTVYGGFLIGGLAVFLYIKKIGIKPIHLLDCAAPALIIGYGVGRMGCHFSGDGDWGIVSALSQPSWFFLPDWMWSFDYPRNVLNQGMAIEGCEWKYCKQLTEGVYPTSVYEIIISFITLAFIWFLRTRVKIAGMIFFIYLVLMGLARFLIEFIRVNEKYELFNLGWSMSQWIALGFMLSGVIGIIVLLMNRKEKSNPEISFS